MTDKDKRAFAEGLKGIAQSTRFKELTRERMNAFWEKLSWLTVEQWNQVCNTAVERCQFFPTIADFYKIVQEKGYRRAQGATGITLVVVDCVCGGAFSIHGHTLEGMDASECLNCGTVLPGARAYCQLRIPVEFIRRVMDVRDGYGFVDLREPGMLEQLEKFVVPEPSKKQQADDAKRNAVMSALPAGDRE